jgi:hypothetical protein
MMQYDGGDEKQGIASYEISDDESEVTIVFKKSSHGYVRPCSPEFKKLLESGNGATRYYNANLR